MSRVLRRADGPNLSNSCVSVAFLFFITRTSTDQYTFMGYPSEDCRRYSVDTILDPDDPSYTLFLESHENPRIPLRHPKHRNHEDYKDDQEEPRQCLEDVKN